ncbi:hypothetical protein FQZ97_959360 [compost metagenome]
MCTKLNILSEKHVRDLSKYRLLNLNLTKKINFLSFRLNFEKRYELMLLRSVLTLFFGGIFLHGFCQDDLLKFRGEYRAKTLEQYPNSEQAFFEPSEKFNIQASYRLQKKGKVISVPTSGTKIKDYREYAKVTFRVDGKKYTLMVYQPVPVLPLYRDYLFLPLKDLTAPTETYGGGRYMDLSAADFRNGRVTLDLNKLYNPYCAFSDGWNCPIPPKGNHLNLRIEAGEKLPLKTEYDHH